MHRALRMRREDDRARAVRAPLVEKLEEGALDVTLTENLHGDLTPAWTGLPEVVVICISALLTSDGLHSLRRIRGNIGRILKTHSKEIDHGK